MNKTIVIVLVILGSLMGKIAKAQNIKVVGKVTTFNQIPLQRVSVVLKENKVLTDENGCFAFNCNKNEKVTFKAHGFFTEKVNIADFHNQDSVKIDLRFRKGKKNFQIATGYGHISEERLTYAINHLETGPDYSSYRTILEVIEGRVSGVNIGYNSINIRGASTLNSGPTPALLVVDGTIVDFNVFSNIPPLQIKSIDVLKGASASRYGSRGMGGVIVVKTKSSS